MRRFLLIALVTLAAIAATPMPIAAQENPVENATASNSSSPSAENESAQEVQEFDRQIDSKTVLRSWSYDDDNEQFTLTLESKETKRVTITEVVSSGEAQSGSIAIQKVTLRANESATVTMPAAPGPNGEAAVVISTAASIDNGQATFISTGQIDQNPFEAFGGTSGLFTGVIMSVVLAALSATYVLRSEESGVVEA